MAWQAELGEDDGLSQRWKDRGVGSAGFLGTVLRQGLGLEGAVALYSRRSPGKGATKMAHVGQPIWQTVVSPAEGGLGKSGRDL